MRIARTFRELVSRLRHALGGRAMETRMREEMQFHVDELTARYRARGMSDDAARHAARAAFGSGARFRDDARDEYRGRLLGEAAQDLRYAVRAMRRRPSLAAAIVVTLALGIGALTTVFSVVNGVVLQPLPYPNAARLTTIEQRWQSQPFGPQSVSPAEYFDYLDDLRAFDAVGMYTAGTADLSSGGDPERVAMGLVTGGVFPALGTRPALGRLIGPADDYPGAAVAVLTHGLWMRRFGGDSTVVGRTITVDGHAAVVLGVLPEGFRLPDEMASSDPSELFTALGLDRAAIRIRGSHFLSAVASRKAGVTLDRADADVAAVARAFTTRYAADYPAMMNFSARGFDLRDTVVGGSRPLLLMLLAAVGCVFLVACVNAASLLLAQAETRRVELAVRMALGAAAPRLVRQLLVECATLAAVAGMCGIGLAAAGTRTFAQRAPLHLPRLAQVTLDWRVVAFAVALTAVAACGAAVLPALRMRRAAGVQSDMRAGGRGTGGAGIRRGARRVLVVGEIAAAVVLLLSAGLLVSSVRQLLAVDPGFQVDHVLTVPVSLPGGSYPSDTAVIAFYDQLEQTAAALPGVRFAGAVAGVPLEARRGDMGIELEGHPIPPGGVHPKADWQVITPGYIHAIGMHVLRGRGLTASDRAGSPGVVVINETMARRYWPGGDALGHRFKLGGGAKPDTVTVVGIAADVRQAGLGVVPDPEMYLAESQFRFWGGGGILRSMSLVVNTTADPASVAPLLREAVHTLAPTVPLGAVRTMRDLRSASVAEPRFMMVLLLISAGVAIVIAVLGVYGLVAFSVAQRQREFGMRLALGAQRRDVTMLVLRESAALALVGAAVGVPAAIAFSGLLRQWLFGVKATDPTYLLVVPAALAAVAMAAAFGPAYRAARADPMSALRAE